MQWSVGLTVIATPLAVASIAYTIEQIAETIVDYSLLRRGVKLMTPISTLRLRATALSATVLASPWILVFEGAFFHE